MTVDTIERLKRASKQPQRAIRSSDNKPTRYYSTKQEKAVAENLNGKRQPNSGATMFAKSDVVLEDFSIECKTKTKPSDSISIKKEWLTKINEEALFTGKKYGALIFNFGDCSNYVIIDEGTFKTLLESQKSS